MSLLEAMYMRKLCVVHDVIHYGQNGFVCWTVDEFVGVIKCTDNDELVEEAYQNLIHEYNTEVMVKKYNEIYENRIELGTDREHCIIYDFTSQLGKSRGAS